MPEDRDHWLQHDRFYDEEEGESLKPILDGRVVKKVVFWAALFRWKKVRLANATTDRFMRRLFRPTSSPVS
ncbi:hypothetical protein EPO56_01530 [Patescibacteria group bacterium]|nr:MAG: hypothetical protein EPO56_01530 [Patescibacteria group bacterium]